MNVYKANDIRGVYKKELTEEIAYNAGKAFSKFTKQKDIILGHDMRTSSPALSEAFINGVTDHGKNIINIGCVGTDVLYFASGTLKKPGAMVTASHNPAKYNGIKFSNPGAAPIGQKTGLKEIEKLSKQEFKKTSKGKIKHLDILPKYAKHVFSFVNKSKIKDLKVVVDAGNGMAAKTFCPVFGNLKIRIDTLDFKLDGTFPNHVANPSKYKNIKDLELEVKKRKADIGMAFDGDTDRVYFVDEKGKRLSSSITASIIIKHLLKKSSNIVYSVVCSQIVPETIKKYKGKAILERVGHTFFKSTMRKTNAIFACEHSGHYYYKKNFRADSGMITALILCEILATSNLSLSKLKEEFEKYHQIEETSIKVKAKQKTINKIEKIYKKLKPKISKKDGITFKFKDYWFNLRKSNTEPVIRLNLEANTKKLMLQKKKEVLNKIR